MPLRSWPDAVPFDTQDGTLIPELEQLIRGAGTALPALLLVAGGDEERLRWSRTAAVRLARAWVSTGRRVLLADLGFAHPTLHETLGLAGDQGLADHFLFGTSLSQLAQPVGDEDWAFIAAGPYAPDPEAILRSPEWPRLLADLAAGDAALLAYSPADTPGLAAFAAFAGALVDLGSGPLDGVRPFSVLARLEPPAAAAPEAAIVTARATEAPSLSGDAAVIRPAATVSSTPPEAPADDADAAFERIRLPLDSRSREALMADLRRRQRDARMAPPAPPVLPPRLPAGSDEAGAGVREAPSPAAQEAWEPPLVERPRAVAGRKRHPLWWTLLLVLLVSVLAGMWHVVSGWLDTRRARAEAAAVAELPVRAPDPVPPPPALDTVLAYAVALEAHQQLPTAERRVAALRSAMPGTGFFIAPLVRDDVLYYHVLAGPVRDSSSAALLLDTLLVRRQKTGRTPGDIRQAPLAFLLGEYEAADSAEARVAELRRLDIPAYTVPLAGPPGRVRVYAGGYTAAAEADVMRQLLQSAGAPDSLVPRVGLAGRQ